MSKSQRRDDKSEIHVLQSIYDATDCSNEVFDWAMLHPSQTKIADRLKRKRLVRSCGAVSQVDGDGFMLDPERIGVGYRLTQRGYEKLTAIEPNGYPPEYRRFGKPRRTKRSRK